MFSWFKKLFKKKSEPTQLLLEYNIESLATNMQQYGLSLYSCRQDSALKLLQKIIDTARNIQILEVSRVSPDSSRLHHHRGRLEALTDLANYITTNLDPIVHEKMKEPVVKKPKLLVKDWQKSGPVI